MTLQECEASVSEPTPVAGLSTPLLALWWDARGDWVKAHAEVDDLESSEAMAVHAYLHRREGDLGNADYWYRRAGKPSCRGPLEAEWAGLVESLLVHDE